MANHIHWLNLTNEEVVAHAYHGLALRSFYETRCTPNGGEGLSYKPHFQRYEYIIQFYDKSDKVLLKEYKYICVQDQSYRVTLHKDNGQYSITVAPAIPPYHAKRPIYLIAHRCNNSKDIHNALQSGANAVECDIRCDAPGNDWIVHHDGYFPERSLSLRTWLSEAAAAAKVFKDRFCLIYLDIKNPEYIESLHEYVNKYFEQTRMEKVRIIYSTAKIEDAEKFALIAKKLNSWEGMTIDYEDDPAEVQEFFLSIGVERFWYSNGINAAVSDYSALRETLKKAGELRDTEKQIKKTCIWTIEKPATASEYLYDELVDGIMTNAGGGDLRRDSIAEILDVVNASEIARLAVSTDDPFACFGE